MIQQRYTVYIGDYVITGTLTGEYKPDIKSEFVVDSVNHRNGINLNKLISKEYRDLLELQCLCLINLPPINDREN